MSKTITKQMAEEFLASVQLDPDGLPPVTAEQSLVEACVTYNLLQAANYGLWHNKVIASAEAAKLQAAKQAEAAKLDWSASKEINPATLPPALRSKYDDMKAAQKLAAESRKAFEDAFNAIKPAPSGQQRIFAYRWGKLTVLLTAAAKGGGVKSKGAVGFDDV